ncbi:amidohydrolase family protein [Streptomyces malaysiensis]|uniref:Amidohydrolase-related domain-containing protein n=1 Tax=Streptomyces malaysiensis TaxID=92644 RepID=A0A2J7YQ89_STRMQ|nr:amidohydrolase family protein [Streptomyces malaysiensis]PNG90187.1 hypothetical protein SMF913_25652 [Streptomyces malaysiensis]
MTHLNETAQDTGGDTGLRIVGLEEHIMFPEVVDAWRKAGTAEDDLAFMASTTGETGRRLAEVGDERRASMRSTGLDTQVLSLSTPGLQNLGAADAAALQSDCNDRIAALAADATRQVQGLATLALQRPARAAVELSRSIGDLGLDGAMVFSRVGGRPLDDQSFWPVFEAAEALAVPLHLHPMTPPAAVRHAYYDGFAPEVSAALASHRLGWHYDTGVAYLRLILAGVFDRFPGLRLVLGHWGELVLFYLDRLEPLARIAGLPRTIGEYVRDHLYVTPSGMLSHAYLQEAVRIVGAEHVLFATDYPFEPAAHAGARTFLQQARLADDERRLIASGNWERLRGDIKR